MPFCIQVRVKEGDGIKQQWSTELVNRTEIYICSQDKNLFFWVKQNLLGFFTVLPFPEKLFGWFFTYSNFIFIPQVVFVYNE